MIAVTRAVSPRLAECELTHLAREPIDIPRACAQHAAYEQLLCTLGDEIVRLPPAPDLPDGVFVEDTALALGAIAVITRPGGAAPPARNIVRGGAARRVSRAPVSVPSGHPRRR